MIPELLTPEEVAEALKLKRRTVIAWLQSGKLPGVKIGGVWRIRREDLAAFIVQGQRDDDTNAG